MVSKTCGWMDATSLDELASHRTEILSSSVGGTDIDYDDLCNEIEDMGDDVDAMASAWFDVCTGRLRDLFATGSATLHRAIAVDDVEAFLKDTAAGAPLGCCWTWDVECATTTLHGGELRHHDILLTANVPASSIDWATTLQQNFGHPSEREVRVYGAVELTSVACMETGAAHAWISAVLSS